MGVYSNNRTQLGKYSSEEVVANESYTHQTGLLEMAVDNIKNDQAIFEAVIGNDFREAAGLVNESVILTESGNLIDKLKDFVLKCWEKIKGIFKSILVKFNTIIIRDNKEFVKKYQEDVVGKDLTKMKYKWSVYHEDKRKAENAAEGIAADSKSQLSAYKTRDLNAVNDDLEELNNGKKLDALLSLAVPSTSKDSFYKDYEKAVFDDEAEVTGANDGFVRDVANILTSSKETKTKLEKLQTKVDAIFKTTLSEIDTFKKESVTKAMDKDEEKSNAGTTAAKRANVARKYVEVQQQAVNMLIKAEMDASKKITAQCRRLFAQAAAFNPKSVKEEALYIEAVGEAAEFEFISSYEDYSL